LREARALAHPLRIRILRLCLDRARTNSELAADLGEQPATVLYHVRTLVRTGFLAEQPHRPGPRGTVEKPYRATGKSARLDDTMPGADLGVLRAVLEAVAAEVAEAGPGALLEGVRMPLWLRPDQLADLRARLQAVLDQFPGADDYLAADTPSDADPYALLLVIHKRATLSGTDRDP
jgi:DNA-binding transcriptional ArsR family regulator